MKDIAYGENSHNIVKLQTQMEHVNGELGYIKKEQREIKKEQANGFKKILTKIDNLDKVYVKKDMYEKDLKEFQKDLERRATNKQWFWQTVLVIILGIVVSSLINILINGIITEVRGEETSQCVVLE
jgi:TPP-dependent indolepyruvate ferredoxin oxidoreductase alpha subunit